MEQPSTSYGGMGGSLWRHRQQCAESLTPAGCTEGGGGLWFHRHAGTWGCSWARASAPLPPASAGSFLKLECHTEPNEFGVPVKRCIRLHQRLRYCPGQ